MNVVNTKQSQLIEAVNKALAELAYATSWGDRTYVTLPLFYPSGSAVSLSVEAVKHGFIVTDCGLAFKEMEMVGYESSFARSIRTIDEELTIKHHKNEIFESGDHEELAALLTDVATYSTRIAWKVLSKSANRKHSEISDYMSSRLEGIFGQHRVERDASLVGPSTKQWRVDAIVHLDRHSAIFEAVVHNHMSVYSTSAMFHDLALLDTPPSTIAVVKDKEAMGNYFNILAQAGNVIESTQSDPVYKSAVANL